MTEVSHAEIRRKDALTSVATSGGSDGAMTVLEGKTVDTTVVKHRHIGLPNSKRPYRSIDEPAVSLRTSAVVDFSNEISNSGILVVLEELIGRAGKRDGACIHENDTVGHFAGKTHFVRDADHRHAFTR